MTNRTGFAPYMCAGALLSILLLVSPAMAGECDDAWDSCMTRCTKKALAAEAEEFPAFLSMENECDATCDAKAAKCYQAAAGKKKGEVKKVLKQRAKAYAKICTKRYEKVLDKCRKAGDDLKKLQACYKKRLRPALLECYAEIDRDLPLPAGEESESK